MRNALLRLVPVTTILAALAPSSALAGGLELPGNGSYELGRAGAWVARASDPSAIAANVAGMIGIPGNNILVSLSGGYFRQCVSRTGNQPSTSTPSSIVGDPTMNNATIFAASNYGSDTDMNTGNARAPQPFPTQCNEPRPSILPQVLATFRISRHFAFGLGIYAPNTSGSGLVYSPTVGTPSQPLNQPIPGVPPANYMYSNDFQPSPLRYFVYDKSLLAFHPMIAAAYSPIRQLRFGVGLAPSFASFSFGTFVSTGTSIQTATLPANDGHIQLNTSGWFLAANIGTQIIPTNWLTIGAQLHLNSVASLSGTASVIAGYYAAPTRAGDTGDGSCNNFAGTPSYSSSNMHCSTFNIDRMAVAQPMSVRVGARFNLPRPGRPTMLGPDADRYDPMTDDVFDIELDFNWERTSSLSTVTLQNSGTITLPGGGSLAAPAQINMLSNAFDTWGLRLGGDVNIVPGLFSLRAGAAYETGSQSPDQSQIHLPSFNTISLHGGLSLRFGRFTISLGYAHYFFMDVNTTETGQRIVTTPTTYTAGAGEANPQGTVLPGLYPNCYNTTTGQPTSTTNAVRSACAINRMTISGAYDLANLGASVRF